MEYYRWPDRHGVERWRAPVADKDGNRLVGIGTAAGTVTRTKALAKEPLMIGIGASSTLILVGVKNGELQMLDSSTLAVTRSVAVGEDIRSLAWWEGGSNGGGRVLAVTKNQNAVNLVDPANGTIARVLMVGDPNTTRVEQYNNFAYVGEKDDQIISLIDLIDRALSGYFTIPGKIGSLLFDQQGAMLFVSLTKDDKLLKLDPNQASLISNIGVTKTLKNVAVNSVTSEATTISDKDADFALIKLSDRTLQTIALPVKADKVVVDSGLNLAIVGTTNDKLSFVDLATNPPSLYPQQVDLDGNIKDMAVDPTRNITVAVVSDKQRIRVVDNITRTEIAQIQTPDKYVAVAIHPGKGLAYLATSNKKLSLFGLTSRTITQTITLTFDVEGIAVDPTLNRAVLTTKDQDKAWILNLDTLQMVTSLTMGKDPGAVAIQTDTHIAVVASKDDDSLSLIDLNTNTATLNFNRIDKPTGLAISNRYNEVLVVSSDKDDLAIVQLPNPAASIASISPSQVAAGAGATTLTINGAHFVDGAVVYFGSTALATTWVSSNLLTAIIPAALLTAAGNNNIRVQNPAPAGGTSASLVFAIVVSAPVLDGVGPATVPADNMAKTFVLVGSNFYSPVSVLVTGFGTPQSFTPISTTLTSAQVSFPANLFSVAGTLSVAVKTDGGTSSVQTITVTAIAPPAPVIGTATAGIGNATVSFIAPASNGGSAITGYIATSSPGNYSGSCVAPCTSIIVAGLAAGVSYSFVVNANNAIGLGPASAASNSVTPLATNLPTLTNVSPDTVLADSGAKLFTMSGSNFSLPMSLAVAGHAGTQTVTVNRTTPTSAQVVLSESFFTTPGTLVFSVTTVAGTSNSSTVIVAAAVPILMSSAPATLVASGQAQMVTLTGTSFIAPVKVRLDGISIAVNPISATQLDVSIPGTLLTTVRMVSVIAEAAGGTSNALAINIGEDIPNQLPIVQIDTPQADAHYDVGTTISFIVEGYDPDGYLTNFELVVDGVIIATSSGGVIYTGAEFPPGPHTVLARATDDRGGTSSTVSSFYVGPNLNEVAVMAVWDGMNNALKAGDVATALTFLTAGAQEKYRPVFEALIGDMPAIIASYSTPSRGQVTEDLAEYAIMRNIPEEGDTQVFFIYFSKDSAGKWLVDSM